jgi:sulfur carrier protein
MSAAPMPKSVLVNGTPRASDEATLETLVAELGIDPGRRGLAVARNGRVVPRASWAEVRVAPGDRIEIVQPLAGG